MQITSLHSLLLFSLCTLNCLCANTTQAQVTPDNTLDTQVDFDGNVSEITGGETRGGNLFHSFQDFSVGTGNEAYFNNANNISNIFSRVTGGNISDIDGLIRANGSASLFLINPNGIIFGENAQLDIGGSFLGSTADSILFDDGEFSATDLDTPPLLTINAPIGLGLPDNPAEIVNRSTVQDSESNPPGLKVSSGNNLSLVGGNIKFEGGHATVPGGNVELGGLSAAGIIGIAEDGSLIFPKDIAKADITLSNGAVVNVTGTGGGNITVNARNLELISRSFLDAGINQDSTSNDAQAGDIFINLTDNLTLDESRIRNRVNEDGVGNSGSINITTGSLIAINGGDIDASTSGQGDAGLVEINATGDVTFDGTSSEGDRSEATSRVDSDGEGTAGGVTISTNNLTLTNGGRVDASTSGQGDAGLVEINATGDVTFDGTSSEGDRSGATSRVDSDGEGTAGGVTISANNLTLTNGGRVDASTSGQGDAGLVEINATGDVTFDGTSSEGDRSGATSRVDSDGEGTAGGVTISANNLTLTNGGRVDASTSGQGDAGLVEINATGDVTFDGTSSEGDRSGATSQVDSDGEGNAGGVIISTTNLNLTNGGRIDSSTSGQGTAGLVEITARDIIFDGATSEGDRSGATSRVNSEGVGNAGGVTISATNLTLTNGGRINASTKGKGDASLVEIYATGDITFDGATSEGDRSEVTSRVDSDGEGNAGGVIISTTNLNLTNGGRIDTSTSSQGNAGFVELTATEDMTFNGTTLKGDRSGVTSRVNKDGQGDVGDINILTTNLNLANGGLIDVASTRETGDGGDINITATEDIILRNNSPISAQSSGNNDGGNINIDARFIIAFPKNEDNLVDIEQGQETNFAVDSMSQFGNDILASAEQGQGGNIAINAKSLFGIEERPLSNSTNDINASSEFGLSGTVEIDILEVDPSQDSLDITVTPVETEIAQTCEPNKDGNQSEFVVTGRGGLPESPEANLDGDFGLEDWRVEEVNSLTSTSSSYESSLKVESENTEPIVEANSWIINDQGKIVLVAHNASDISGEVAQQSSNCQTN
ncbi:filamentous hemagglutinin N-terminal domain-containing protein [Pleurocapsa sp. PCC 7319]|uniref:two-partner secretion domain-containing protein n=1 Tax=Pleurocapsa sp. PCC 7319 TaxID=118161 RepID=UPI000345B90B|nr:filamentous hemagglutinin N-terminal domain-containing protein [Pleurocapsa sp. PCC 7319]